MHASVLVILYEGHETLEVYQSEIDAQKGLLRFVDQWWSNRFGSLLPPLNEAKRINAFFKEEGIYLVAKADLSEMSRQIDDGEQERSGPKGSRLR
ncbi:hypothetical protein [Sphingobium sp. D43FB]|uniref:hypothetical protein n=1 Tax=Sphingobium sp. D43FB TaxID=2017595 RepID=UPI0020D18CAE|nr:hypothetical protein [Sphingobium sp. D43FB]